MPNMLEEKDRNLRLRIIKDGKCSPFLGAGDYSEKVPVSSIANELAKKYDYPMEDSFDELHIQVYCHNCREFATELKTRWEAFNRDT